MEICFFIKGRPNFWPQIENRLWVVLALIGGGNKTPGTRPLGKNSLNQQIWSKIEPERVPKMDQKHRKSLPNGRQQEPQGGGAKCRPLGAAPKAPPCCLPFGKDFRCFGLTSEAHSGSIFIEICRFSEFSQGSSEKVEFVPPIFHPRSAKNWFHVIVKLASLSWAEADAQA